MSGRNSHIEVTLDSVVDSVDLAEQITVGVAAVVGFGEEARHKIGMSVREGVINALQYGNQLSPEKKIRLSLSLEPDRMLIRVVDQGKGFDLADVPDPLDEENILKCSGRGILLMRSFMDDFSVGRSPEGGAEVSMAIRYPMPRHAGSTGPSRSKEE